MNGIHDLGGMHGFGPVEREANEPVFHAEWERRCFALTLAMGAHGAWNIDMSRYARERTQPLDYLATSYYEHWLHGLELLLVEHGFLTPRQVQATAPEGFPQTAEGPHAGDRRMPAIGPAQMLAALRRGDSARIDADVPPRFQPGAAVVTHNTHPRGHTRIPRYARGRRGVVHSDHGVFAFPDTNALGKGPKPQHCYSVRFAARELWGPDASARDAVYIDLWDDYLEPA